MERRGRDILIDADVISHFVSAGEEHVLGQIFPNNRIYMLDKVHAELQRWRIPAMLSAVSDLLSRRIVRLMDFPDDNETIRNEYLRIKSMLFKGDGESACLAVVRYNNTILASSNLIDIKHYCSVHKIDYLTTMDFLCEAFRTGLFDEARCDRFIQRVLASGSRLPVRKMSDHCCRTLSFV